MSQPITNLAVGSIVNLVETLTDGTSENIPFLIIATGESNPYGADNVFCVRKCATGAGTAESSLRFNTTSDNVEYENSNLDNFMTGEFAARFDAATLACVDTSPIICYNYTEGASYTLARQFFALSNKELGGTYTTDESVNPGYFTSNALRICYSKSGSAVFCWTRSPASASSVCFVYTNGNLYTNSPAFDYYARPAFNLKSSTLVSDEPNEDGSYNVLPDPDVPYKTVEFTAKLGDTATMPTQAKVVVEAVYDQSMTVWACNNYNDDTPAWEQVTPGQAHTFANTTKTADSWAVGVKVHAESESTIYVYEPAAIIVCEEASA
ncbi:MAG: DUF6273 domain-containing protein [Faecousia sp.]